MGGVARRATYLRELRSKHTGVPLLVVETGGFTRQSDALDDPVNRWVVRAFEAMGVHAVNTSVADLRRLHRLSELGRLSDPIRALYLATAVDVFPGARFPVKPYAILSLRPEAGGQEVKVGIIAVSRPGEEKGLARSADVVASLRKHVPEVDAQADVVVLLSWMSDPELYATAGMFPAIDVILNGATTGEGRDLPRTGNAVIHESAHEGVALGVLEVEWDAKGHITRSRNEQVPLPPMIADSPSLVELVDKARRDESAFGEELARRSPALASPLAFAGAKACADCHEKAYKAWEKSRHAHAIDTLKKGGNEFNKDCLPCHVTAWDAPGGFVNMLRTPQLANVQCEACHDTALDHSNAPMQKHPGIGEMQKFRKRVSRTFCLRCHTEENSPRFDYEVYWPRIAH